MSGFYQLTFFPDKTVREYCGSCGNKYLLNDGELLEVNTAPVWCCCCNKFVDGEFLLPMPEIDRELAELHDPSSSTSRWVEEIELNSDRSLRDNLIAETTLRKRWRENRVSAPKCLTCGATDIISLPLGQEIPCPFSSGTLIIECVGMCSTEFSNLLFSPEGERISTGE